MSYVTFDEEYERVAGGSFVAESLLQFFNFTLETALKECWKDIFSHYGAIGIEVF